MDLRRLTYFVEVANLRSFTRAAESLSVAQSALSRHVQALEAEFGCALLLRTTRGVELTGAGAKLLELGEGLLGDAERIKIEVQRSHATPNGGVVVGLPPSVAAVLASPLAEEVQRTYPAITLRVIEGLGQFLQEWLSQGKIDLAVLSDTDDSSKLTISRLAHEEMVLVVAPPTLPPGGNTIAMAAVAEIELSVTTGFRGVVDRSLVGTGISLRYAEEIDSIPVIIERVLTRPLATILPYGYVRADVRSKQLRILHISDPGITRQLLLAINPRRARDAAVQAVSQVIQKSITNSIC